MWEYLFFHIHASTGFYVSYILILTDEKWYLAVAFLCVALSKNGFVHLFIQFIVFWPSKISLNM